MVLFVVALNLFSMMRSVVVPGCGREVLIDCDSLSHWGFECDNGSSGSRELVSGLIDNAIKLNWNIGTGEWVQAKYRFSEPVDLSTWDIFGLNLHGDTSSIPNLVSIMFADTNNVFFGLNFDYSLSFCLVLLK